MMYEHLLGYLKNIIVHKWYVFKYSWKLGIPWRGICHDMSKLSVTEIKESIKFYRGPSSPISEAKRIQGYSTAWLHHKGRNPHHFEYWMDNIGGKFFAVKMPYIYVLELVADYLAKGKTYRGKYFTMSDERDWWLMSVSNNNFLIHPRTREMISKCFRVLAHAEANGENGFKYIRYNRKDKKEYDQ